MERFFSLSEEERKKRVQMQTLLELEIEDYSVKQYWKSYDDDPSSGTPEQQLIWEFVNQAAAPYTAWLDYFKQMPDYDAVKIQKWFSPLFILEPETIAAIVISEIVQTLLSRETLDETTDYRGGKLKYSYQSLAKQVGKAVKKICEYRRAKDTNLEDWKKQSHFLKNWEPKRCDAFAKKFGGGIDWKPREVAEVGNHILHIATLSKVIHKEQRQIRTNKGGAYKSETVVYIDEAIIDRLVNLHAIEAFLKMIYRPMIVPPVEHTLELAGGPLELNLRKDTIDGLSKLTQHDIDALNILQRTEWSINKPVLDVMETMFNNNWEFCNLPPRDLDRIAMPRVADLTGDETEQELHDRRQRIAERAEMWSEWHKSDQKRMQMSVRLGLAKELHTLGFFYHSYTMDFRGRAYSVCSMLSPQAGDFDRGLLKFATPIQQTDEGFYWQKVALANAMDGAEGWNGEASDKASFDDRVAWVDANHDQLLYVADNPLETASLWADNETKKKNPSFQRLASILDYAEAVRDGTTSYPVQLDGACNGSQHWSAIRRDPVIAELTNVVPVDKPQDLYQYVADIATTEMVHRAENQGNKWCQKFVDYWGKLKRKVVKRATMCDAYGITPHGIRKYAREEGHLSWVPKDQMAAAVNELAFLTIKGLDGAMEESNKGKDYVRYISDLYSESGKHMRWEVPGGMTVVNKYVEFVPKVSRSHLYGKKYIQQVTFGEPTKNPDGASARGAIAPNFIHSFDAAHMRLAILGMHEAGVINFSMIHDSYGCPAPQIPAMRQIIKETFLEVHQVNQLEQLSAYAEQQLGCEVEPSPPTGSLDINGVLGAEYLFG